MGTVQRRSHRLVSLDYLRGIVIVLMAVDHASGAVNSGRLITDGAFMWTPGTALPAAQFLTRWITHLCAPTFVFLAGAALALSVARKAAAGVRPGEIDRLLLTRGLFIAGCEVFVSLIWMPAGTFLLQVLYAIGTSFILMIPLRRLSTKVQVALAFGILLLGEATIGLMGWTRPEATPLLAMLLLVGGRLPHLIIAYPTLHWLAIMLLGAGFGSYLLSKPEPARVRARLMAIGAAALGVFSVVRGLNGYGNMALLREGDGVVQWLHVSKYPPSISFVALELGLMCFVLAALSKVTDRVSISVRDPFLVFGKTPMFFYLLHSPLLSLAAWALGVQHKLGLLAVYAFAVGATAVLYPAARRYGRYKSGHSNLLTRFV